jgi:acetyl esterase/lipase
MENLRVNVGPRFSSWPRIARLALVLSNLVLGGCTGPDIVNALVPGGGVDVQRDISYGSDPRQTLDLYRPPGSSTGARPVVVFFYGGNWDSGSKRDYFFVGQALASRGFVVVIPDYRLYPQVQYPVFLQDNAAAVAWTFAHIGALGGDPAEVSVMGHSAGAYNAMMLALDPRWLGADRSRLRSAIGLAGPYDFLPLTDPEVKAVFATEPDLPRTQPINFADNTAPPVFLAAGLGDTTVKPENSKRLAARLRAAGSTVQERYYDGTGHVTLIAAMAWPLRFLAPVLDDTTAFLKALPPKPAS